MQEHLPGIPVERWAPVAGFDGYEVSDRGRVRRLARVLEVDCGGHRHERHLSPLCLKARLHQGRLLVSLDLGNGRRAIRGVAALVLTAFVGPRPSGMAARALDPETPTAVNCSWAPARRIKRA